MVKTKKSRGPTPKAKDRTWHKNYQPPKTRPNKPGVKGIGKSVAEKREGLIYGVNPVYEYLADSVPAQKLVLSSTIKPDAKIQQIISFANNQGVQIFELPKTQIDTLTHSLNHQGVVLYAKEYEYADFGDILDDSKPVIILDHITDPHNLGAVIRSAAAFKANVIIPNARAASVNATVWKTSAGNAMKTKIAQVPNLNTAIEKLQQARYFVVGLEGTAQYDINDEIVTDNKRIAFVAGNEGAGIAQLTKKNCDILAKIPTAVESLNVAQAVTIALYSFSQ